MNLEDAKIALSEYDLTGALIKDEPHDIISEIADSNIDVYNSQLLDWVAAGDNYQYVEDSINEFGFPNNSEGKPDFFKAIMQGQYKQNEEILWEAWEEIKKEESFKHYGNKQI